MRLLLIRSGSIRRFCKAIAEYADTQFENIIVGNGSTELISLFYSDSACEEGSDSGPYLF